MSQDPADAPSQHRAYAPESLSACVLTVSDSRTPDDDTSGDLIAELLGQAGHRIAKRTIVRDDPSAIRAELEHAIADPAVDCALVTGGTGVSPRDNTVPTATALIEKQLPGFGELFRQLSFEEIGPAAMLSRALAGTTSTTAIFIMPGSRGAVRTAMTRLILPELPHLVGQLRR